MKQRMQYPREGLVHRVFERWAAATPARAAVVCGDARVTYGDLDAGANLLAGFLRRSGVGQDSIVGVLLPRSAAYLEAFLGVMKAGGAVLPLDLASPPGRIAEMVERAGARVLLVDSARLGSVPSNVEVLDIKERGAQPVDLNVRVTPSSLAQVIFTSGSTGKPKGVGITHASLHNYISAILELLELPSGSSFATVTPVTTDLGNTAILAALGCGGTLHLVPSETAGDPESLAAYQDEASVDCLKITPTHLGALLDGARDPARLLPRRCVVIGGEAVHWQLIDRIHRLQPGCAIYNHYGPTEATIGVLACKLPGDSHANRGTLPPMGAPIKGASIRLLDRDLRPVPVNEPGEIYIAGVPLARGYLAEPGKTAEVFLPDPSADHLGTRMYRTGDLARRLPDGRYEFIGRFDEQVKIRGYRVEPGEIETALSAHPDIRSCRVVAREPKTGDRQLVAYFVSEPHVTPSPTALRSYLADRLPEPLVPSAFVAIDALPTSRTGKLDLSALPLPAVTPEETAIDDSPPDAVESALIEIWREILEVDRLGVSDNFFELGGNSFSAIRLTSRIRVVFQVEAPVGLVFRSPTIAEMARSLSELDGGSGDVAKTAELLRRVRAMDPEELRRELARRQRGTT